MFRHQSTILRELNNNKFLSPALTEGLLALTFTIITKVLNVKILTLCFICFILF
jgi:hypothetical protein